jgi:hypothetical protein
MYLYRSSKGHWGKRNSERRKVQEEVLDAAMQQWYKVLRLKIAVSAGKQGKC